MNEIRHATITIPPAPIRQAAELARGQRGADPAGFRCPECGTETAVAPLHGGEIVSVYCLRHKDGADGRIHPVHMLRVTTTSS